MNELKAIALFNPRPRRGALLVALAGALLCLIGFFVNRPQLFRSWLFAHQFFLALALGGLGMLMVHHLMGGQWGILVERPLEAMTRTLPLMALLFIPLLFGLRDLYPWTNPTEVATSDALQRKAAYLNVPFFLWRAAGYFAIWLVLGWLYTRWSLRRDAAADPALLSRRMRGASPLGLILYFLTMTFAAIDWMMSLEPEWYSTIYGAVVIMGQALAALALGTIVLHWAARDPEVRPLLTAKAMGDLGNMVLAFVIMWTYMSFVQYLIIWMGNLSEETPWVSRRTHGGWGVVASGLIVLHFFLPFLLLLFRGVKWAPRRLAAVGWLLLAMRLVGLDWLIAPAYRPRLSASWLDAAALATIGGLWVAAFIWSLSRAPLVALHDPRAHRLPEPEEVAAHE
jgi:hypothetical protein